MREIVLDTETTGLDPHEGHRIVEIGAVEIFNGLPSGRTYHQYINPQRNMPAEAFAVHGLGDDFLKDKPVFADIANDFVTFIGDAQLVIHNASFDMKFINAELSWINKTPIPLNKAIDTLQIARKKFPGSPASLDALCRRFNIDNSARTLHGALLDSEILAEVYLELSGGRQPDFELSAQSEKLETPFVTSNTNDPVSRVRPSKLPLRITEEEKAAHAAFVDSLGDRTIWRKVN
ncbi:MAG: DNA polymerase III subunit epsilon [Proteobacteria bacterium]|nr:DNA polymerase III subunit epsilon [Pseudomonadota bacterium]MDA1293215.1 DNA polymerase III subunit epsilon [Pseudomonadota bacterium]